MALTPSTMLSLGTQAPDFNLSDVTTGKNISPGDFKNKSLLVMFICKHCPYVVHIQDELARLGETYSDENIGIVAISSNDAENYSEDAPEQLKVMAAALDFKFPYCHDESQEVAKSYQAACTPDFFLFDKDHKLVYRGQLDDSRPGNSEPVNGKDLRSAIDALLKGEAMAENQTPSMGCNIKWKPGNAPDYF